MTRLTGNNGGLFRKTTATGLVLLLLLFLLPGCAARHMPDWSRVQAVPPETKTEVQLYKDGAPQGASRKVKGHFDSATADSVTLTLEDGQTRTLPKSSVRKVLTRRPFLKRKPGWIALGVAFAIWEFFINIDASEEPTTASARLGGHATITLPTTAAFFYGSRMGGIYEVPPEHRKRPTGSPQSGAEGKTPGNPEDHPRRD